MAIGFAFRRHLLHDRAAHRKIRLGHHRPIDIARHAHFHLAGGFILQHQEAALRPGQLNDAIHDLVEHLFQFQRGVDGLAHFVQRMQRLPLVHQRIHRRLKARHQALHLQQRLLGFQHIGRSRQPGQHGGLLMQLVAQLGQQRRQITLRDGGAQQQRRISQS